MAEASELARSYKEEEPPSNLVRELLKFVGIKCPTWSKMANHEALQNEYAELSPRSKIL